MKPNKYKNTNQMTQYSNSNTSFETSNIKFGDLNIVLNSFNSVPDVQSFYETVPNIVKKISETPIIFQDTNRKLNDKIQNTDPVKIFACTSNVQFDEMLSNYKEVSDSNKVTCWWCRIVVLPKEQCCFLPLHYDEMKKVYTKHGYFCCWECVKSYNFSLIDNKSNFRCYLIRSVCRLLYGIQLSRNIKYAPHWITLNRYGGSFSDAQYINNYHKTTLQSIDKYRHSI